MFRVRPATTPKRQCGQNIDPFQLRHYSVMLVYGGHSRKPFFHFEPMAAFFTAVTKRSIARRHVGASHAIS